MVAGEMIQQAAQGVQGAVVDSVGAANLVTSVVLAYRGLDTLGELAILFAAATGAGMVLQSGSAALHQNTKMHKHIDSEINLGELFDSAATMLTPLLLLVGVYIILHGHLTPGGGFQGGVVVAVALFLPSWARNGGGQLSHKVISRIEGGAGASFIVIGLVALWQGDPFLTPWLAQGELGELFSAGTLPLLYLMVGLKVGAELAALLKYLAIDEQVQS
jgi:multicomponent Na+:H+ antiporter subunit B